MMKINLFHKTLLILFVLLLSPWLAAAQDAVPFGDLYNLRTSSFPLIQVSMDVMDTEGKFLSGIQAEDIIILENGQELEAIELKTFDPGLEFVVAINPNFRFAIMDINLSSRLDKIKAGLLDWAGELPTSINHAYSLVTPDGPTSFHVKDLNSWLTGLETWQPPLDTIIPSQDMLSQAIDLASTSLLEPGARRAVLLITPNPEPEEIPIVQDLAEKAKQLDVHVFVWVVVPPDAGPTSGLQALEALAEQTGGTLLMYSGNAPLPSPDEVLDSLRTSYKISYSSGLRSTGTHSLVVQVNTETGPILLPDLSFDVEVEAPNPILVSPPNQILRQFTNSGDYDSASLKPDSQLIEMLIEYPDGHQRPLARTDLIVDGEIVDSNTSAPFEQFIWDLKGYTENGEHQLQVQVVDSLGLEKISISIPVMVIVEETPNPLQLFYLQYRQWIILGIGVIAGLLLAWRIIKISRILKSRKKSKGKTVEPLPLEEKSRLSAREKLKKVPAWLEPVGKDVTGEKKASIPLSAQEVRIGSDPMQVHFVLDDPSVGDFHATITRKDEMFLVSDMGSAAGTWVNFEKMEKKSQSLKHGDILHFGILEYHFRLSNPPELQEPKIIMEPKDSPCQ